MPITHASSSFQGAGYDFNFLDSLIVLRAIFVKTLNYQLEWTDSSVGRNLCKYPIFTPPLTNKSRLAGFEFHNFHTTFKLYPIQLWQKSKYIGLCHFRFLQYFSSKLTGACWEGWKETRAAVSVCSELVEKFEQAVCMLN